MRNRVFQTIWFGIKHLFPRKVGTGLEVRDYAVRIVVQLMLARLFGGPDLVLIGDSNSEAFSNEKDMKELSPAGVACGLGIGGTRGDQWAAFFATLIGRLVRLLIGNARVIWNVGGNHVLQQHMAFVVESYEALHALFPESYIILIPPIHYSVLSALGLSPEAIKDDVRLVNAAARVEWPDYRVIDLYDAFMDPKTGEAYSLLLADMVHYAPVARGIIIDVILKRVKG